MTYVTILIEGSFLILVWFHKTKLLVMAPVVGLYVGIALMRKKCDILFSPGDGPLCFDFFTSRNHTATLSLAHRWVERFQIYSSLFQKEERGRGLSPCARPLHAASKLSCVRSIGIYGSKRYELISWKVGKLEKVGKENDLTRPRWQC